MKKIVLILLLLSMSLFSKNNMLQKHILVLHSYNKSMSWVANIDKAIDDTLQPDKNNYILHREYMDTKRIFTKEYLQDLKKVYKNKYKNIKFDLILASDNNAFDFLRKNRDELFGNVPVSFCGVNYFKDSDLDGLVNYTGTAEIFDAKRTVTIALKLVPSIKNIYVVNDYTTTGKAWTKTIKEQLKGIDKNIIYIKNSSIEELKTKLSSLNPKKNMVLLGVYFKDKNGEYFTYEKIGKIIAKNSNAPVFSLLKFNLGEGGVVGGSVIGGYYQGAAMSKIAKKILNGTLVKNIPVLKDGATKFIFDYDALRKYNLDIKKLPKDAVILNKKISFFEEHKVPIMIITILIIIIIILLTNIRQRKKAQILLKQSQKVVEEQNKNLENEGKKRTQELEKQKETFEAIYNTSKDGIAILDMQSNFLKVNPAYIEMTGFTKEELLADSCLNLTVEKDVQASKDAMQEVLKVGYIKNFEKDCKIKDNKVITINMSMSLLKNPDRILISVRDITQIKEAKEIVKGKIENFEFLFNNTIEAIGLFKDYKFIDINEAGMKLFGFQSKEEVLGKHILSVVAPESIELAKHQLGTVIDTPYELMAQKVTGEKFPALVRGLTTVMNGEEIRVTTLVDISDLKNKEKELELAKNRAEESTKLKSEFLANMSHEIRTPMNGIVGMTHLALQSNLNQKQKQYISTISSSANSLLNIINDILDFSKIEAGKLNIDTIDFRLDELLSNISSVVEFKAQDKGLEFTINYSDDLALNVHGDNLRISQVLLNLLNNAIKFTSSGYVNLIIENSSDDFIFKVCDSGIGMTQLQQKNLFEAFSQADGSTTRKYGGTGLGLSISKQLVELMGGKIWVESQENKGSTFSFTLKLPKAIHEIKTLKEEKQNINTLKNSQILLVEDNTTNQEIVIGLLENSSIKIDVANNGKEAVDMFTSNKDRYELILMDIQMPIMDGYEATKQIRALDKDIAIIALTANAMKEDIERTKNAGMSEHLNKPIEVEKLYATLLKYISRKVNREELIVKSENLNIPNFSTIDTKIGLSHMANNEKLYTKILNDFVSNYENINFETLHDEEFKRTIHTLKGLSANIGASNINQIALEIEHTKDKTLLPNLYEELDKVISELKEKLNTTNSTANTKEPIEASKRDELFKQLKIAVNTKRSKKCKPVIEEIEKYQLNSEDKELFDIIKNYIKEYDFKKAIEILGRY